MNIRIRDLVDFLGFLVFDRYLIRNLYRITQEIILRIRDLIDFEGFPNLLIGFS